jgi:hypothetical protein
MVESYQRQENKIIARVYLAQLLEPGEDSPGDEKRCRCRKDPSGDEHALAIVLGRFLRREGRS